MKRILLVTILIWQFLPVALLAEAESKLIISELQNASADSATEEFIEIANIGSIPIDLDGLKIQYLSASGSSWKTKLEPTGQLLPNQRIVISTEGYIEGSSFTFAGGLASNGGHIRILETQSEVVIDLIGWGSATNAATEPAAAHAPSESIKRAVDEDGYFSSTGDNSRDWFVSSMPTPRDDGIIQPEVVEEPDLEITDDSPTTSLPKQTDYPILKLSEVMPDPVPPLSDAEDEFVEIFNPNSFSVSLADYSIKIGSRSTELSGYSIESQSYLAIFSIDTSISLSNSGKSVELVDGNGKVLDSVSYLKAEAGMSWSEISGIWLWSTPSPNQKNMAPIITENDVSGAVTTNKDRDYTSSSDMALAQSPERSVTSPPAEAEIAPINYSVLAGVGFLSVCYVIYEYRQDLGNRLQQLRRHLSLSRENRAATKGRRGNRISQRYRRWKDSFRAWSSNWYQKLRPGS